MSKNFAWQSSATPPDFRALQALPQIDLVATVRTVPERSEYALSASVRNPRPDAVAFFIRLKLLKPGVAATVDNRVLPTFYEDNYFSLLPGEEKTVTIRCAQEDAGGAEPELWVEGWNIRPKRVP